MRDINYTITKVLGFPTFAYGKYWVAVQYECEGDISYTKVAFETYDEACLLKVG